MTFWLPPPPQTTTKERLSGVVRGLNRVVTGFSPSARMPDWMARAISVRVIQIVHAVSALLLAMQAGTLRPRRSPAPGGTRQAVSSKPANATMRLPSDFAWLVKLLGWHVMGSANHLRILLAEPEMMALLEASPRAVRTIKPLCRMLGIKLQTPPAPVPPTPPECDGPPGRLSTSNEGRNSEVPSDGFGAARRTAEGAVLFHPHANRGQRWRGS